MTTAHVLHTASIQFGEIDQTIIRLKASVKGARYTVELWILDGAMKFKGEYHTVLKDLSRQLTVESMRMESGHHLARPPMNTVYEVVPYLTEWAVNEWRLVETFTANHRPLTKEVTAAFYGQGEWNHKLVPSKHITKVLKILDQATC